MPKTNNVATKKDRKGREQTQAADTREVVFPTLSIYECSTASERGPFTVEQARNALGWETERQYQARMLKEHPGTKPEQWLFGENGPRREDGSFQPIHCVNTRGEKVVCWNNVGNRPFDVEWSNEISHMVLFGEYAGPHTIPGETINGETIRISKYGNTLSGQHQETGLIFADELLEDSRKEEGNARNPKYPFWNGHEHPFIETIVVTGLSEDERVLRTIDYVKPRSVADMLYTMPLFKDSLAHERKELTRMLSGAIDMLWRCTDRQGYKTHPEVDNFLKGHKRLLQCVEHIFRENSSKAEGGGRKISKLRLNAGMSAAICYMMGCSGPGTDIDKYRSPKQGAPCEKGLDWSLWDRALEFWHRLAHDRQFKFVRDAITDLKETTPIGEGLDQGLGGRVEERLAILSKAWEVFHDHPDDTGPPFNEDDRTSEKGALRLHYSDLDDEGEPLPEGEVKLLDDIDFGGIYGPRDARLNRKKKAQQDPPMKDLPTEECIYGAGGLAEQARARREQKADERAARKK